MKKKGLIISTIVMVVVLIASLTTATYAWFSSSASAQVNTVNLTVGAASDVAIGVNKVAITEATRSLQTSYASGTLTSYNTETKVWAGGNNGLGSNINTGVNLNVTAGVGTGTKGGDIYIAKTEAELESASYISGTNTKEWSGTKYYTAGVDQLYTFADGAYTALTSAAVYSSSTTYYVKSTAAASAYAMDLAYTRANTLLTGEGNTIAELENIDEAKVNDKGATGADVLDLQMAIKPIKAGNYGTYCVITITPTSDFVGMAAALWADISINGVQKSVVDLFDQVSTPVHFDTQTPLNGSSEIVPYVFYFDINDFSTTEMSASSTAVTGFSIRLFVAGYDEDCNVNATGTGATIDIQFYGTKNNAGAAQYDALQDVTSPTKLTLVNA